MKAKKFAIPRLVVLLSILFLVVTGVGLYLGSHYINRMLLRSGQATAIDIALLVKNNFHITDDEVAYMKTLTFNEMEVDPINMRLMDVGNGVSLNAGVSNVYLVAPLSRGEYRYCADEATAGFLGFSMTTPLDGVWLLNGKINDSGVFEAAQREDIFRYTALDADQRWGMEHRESFGTLTSDAWGSFITGYAPIYTTEGSFVGLLGVDMDPDPYQSSAQRMTFLVISVLAASLLTMLGLSVLFYVKYTKANEERRQYQFFSRMSHEMRTPMNGILGMVALSKDETDPAVLRHNFALVEASAAYLLTLINQTLNEPQGGGSPASAAPPVKEKIPAEAKMGLTNLTGKSILLCEDHPINAEITRRLVEKAGGAIAIAENGQRGVEMFKSAPIGFYDAILMDIRMPVMDGIQAAKQIRAMAGHGGRAIPIIALTANSYDEDIRRTKEAGMDAHLTKPVSPALLYETIANAIAAGARTKMELEG